MLFFQEQRELGVPFYVGVAIALGVVFSHPFIQRPALAPTPAAWPTGNSCKYSQLEWSSPACCTADRRECRKAPLPGRRVLLHALTLTLLMVTRSSRLSGIRVLGARDPLWWLLAALSWSAPALAEPREGKASPAAEAAAAQALFEQGRELMAKGMAQEACPKFEESQRLEPATGTELNLARCYEQVGRLASAYALFTKVAATARSAGQRQREEVARERAEAVRPKLTKLTIVVPAGNEGKLRVERDGSEVREAQWGFPVPVDPGPHQVRAFGGALGEWSHEVVVPSDGGVHRVVIPDSGGAGGDAAPLANQTWAIVSGSIGVAGLATSGIFGLLASSRSNEADDLGCRGKVCPTGEGVELRRSAHAAGNIATAGLGVGVVGLAGAAALLWWLPELSSGGERELALLPLVVPGGSAVVLDGRF